MGFQVGLSGGGKGKVSRDGREKIEPLSEEVGKKMKGTSYPSLSEGGAYRPTSKAGDASGESSVVMVKTPSNLRSG